jgi:ABC-type nitrate/sulfonate/bicarbonate transport system permease component
MARDGTLFAHVGYTLARIGAGLTLAALAGVPLGMLMGRVRPVERFVLPLVSVLSPIPSLAWVPLFILWFGLGNTASVALGTSFEERRFRLPIIVSVSPRAFQSGRSGRGRS